MFYEKIEKELKARKMTLNQLAKGAGFPQSGTTRWKNGSMPGTEILIKICKYLNVSADYLLDLEDEAPPLIISDEEKELILQYRECDSGTRKSIKTLASTGAAEAQEEKRLLDSKNIG